MQRYSFFANHQNFCREKLKIYTRFNSCLQLKHHIVDAHIIILYTKEAVLRTATRGCTQQESTTDRRKQRKILQEKESIIFKKGGLEPQKQRFGSTKVKVWHCETSTKVIRVGRYEHPRRPIRASASVVTSIRVDRYEHPRRSMRMTKVGSMKRKRDGVKREKRGACPLFLRSPPDQTRTQSVSICEYNLMFS